MSPSLDTPFHFCITSVVMSLRRQAIDSPIQCTHALRSSVVSITSIKRLLSEICLHIIKVAKHYELQLESVTDAGLQGKQKLVLHNGRKMT
jgi:hypothetical protein